MLQVHQALRAAGSVQMAVLQAAILSMLRMPARAAGAHRARHGPSIRQPAPPVGAPFISFPDFLP